MNNVAQQNQITPAQLRDRLREILANSSADSSRLNAPCAASGKSSLNID